MIRGLGKRLRKERDKLGLTQPKVAEMIESTVGKISTYENGTATPPSDELAKLAKFYQVSADYLLGIDIKRVSVDRLTDDEIETIEKLIGYIRDNR